MASLSAEAPFSDAQAPLTADGVSEALAIEVYDREGKAATLGELTKGKRTILVFIRHFWCLNCQAYIRCISKAIPPSNVPSDAQVLVVGCGSYQPIDTYIEASSSAYPIYTDPTQRLHKIFNFKWTLTQGESGEGQRDYMRTAGSTMMRILGGIKGAFSHLEHLNYVGPKSLNGGEIVLSADGKCEYIHRMQNTEDHTSVEELAKLIGAEYIPTAIEKPNDQSCGEACAPEANKP